MEGFTYVDIFATKGIEYILVIGFLIVFVFYWKFLSRSAAKTGRADSRVKNERDWFHLSKSLYYHPGHSWVRPESENTVTVGIDDFAQKLLGKPDALNLPEKNFQLEQGNIGWKVKTGENLIDMVSPINGEVIAVNQEVLKSPELIGQDPYGKGWLVKVQVSRLQPNLRNLFSGKLAIVWMENTIRSLREKMGGELGMVMQDGGIPVSGFINELPPKIQNEIISEFFLTK